MKQLTIVILFLMQGSLLFGQHEKRYIKKGNELYKQQKYQEAEADYRKSVGKNADSHREQNIEGNFNLGDALYKQKKFADAGEQFNKLAESSGNNKALTAAAYHNMGNSFLENKKLEESIEAYKKALLNNPKDDETRYNLAYAQDKLKKQQQQNKQNKDNKNQDNKNQDKKNQDNKNNNDKNKDNKDKQNQDKKDQQKNQQQPDKLSKEDAERMLDALNNNEKQTQEKLKNKKLKGEKLHITKDW
jgi:Ca-activated chloride channel homolog